MLCCLPDTSDPARNNPTPSFFYSLLKGTFPHPASISRDAALFTWPPPFWKPTLSQGFGGQAANLLTSKGISWQCDRCWPIALTGLALWQLAVIFWRLEPQSHAPWQQQNNILMPAIMANAFGRLMNKIPFSVSFYNSDMLLCCPVSPRSSPPPSLRRYFSHSIIIPPVIGLAETDTSNFFPARGSMLFLLVSEQYSPDIVGRRLCRCWGLCETALQNPSYFAPTSFQQCQLRLFVGLACQLWYLFSKHAFDSSVFSGKFGLGSTSLTYLLIQRPQMQGGRGKGEPRCKSCFL